MLTAKLFACLAGITAVSAILARVHSPAPVPIYLQLIAALSCVIFAAAFFVAELCIRPPLNRTIGLVQCGFVGISVCILVFEFDLYPLLSNKPDLLGAYLIPASALSFLIACAVFAANATWTVIRVLRSPASVRPAP